MLASTNHVLDLGHFRNAKTSSHMAFHRLVPFYKRSALFMGAALLVQDRRLHQVDWDLWEMNADIPHVRPHLFHHTLSLMGVKDQIVAAIVANFAAVTEFVELPSWNNRLNTLTTAASITVLMLGAVFVLSKGHHLERDFLCAWLVGNESFAHVTAWMVELFVALVVIIFSIFDLELARCELPVACSTTETVWVIGLAIHIDALAKFEFSLASWTLHDADSITCCTGGRCIVRVEVRAARAVPAPLPIGLGTAICLNVSVLAAVFFLHWTIVLSVLYWLATSHRSGRCSSCSGWFLLRSTFRMIIAAIDHLEATGKRTFAARAAETVWMIRYAVHVETFAVFDLALARGALKHTDGVAGPAIGGRIVGVQERTLRTSPAHNET